MDESELELIERRLAERVAERVRKQLFRVYAVAGSGVIAVLGFFGWNLLTFTEDQIRARIEESVKTVHQSLQADIDEKNDRISQQTTESEILSKRARDVIQRLDEQLDRLGPQIDTLNETVAKVDLLDTKSKEFSEIYEKDIKPSSKAIETNTEQIRQLALELDRYMSLLTQKNVVSASETVKASPAQPGSPSNLVEAEAQNPLLNEIVQATLQSQSATQAIQNKVTVFFQFAGGTRGQAEEISSRLEADGYIIPGEERIASAARTHEVRYFHSSDAEQASKIAEALRKTLLDLEYGQRVADSVEPKLVKGFETRTKEGLFEIWLEIPPR